MNRRTFLTGACGGLVLTSGCLNFDTRTPLVSDREITVREQGCNDKQNTASLNYDRSTNRLHIEGVLSGTTKCGDLGVSYAYNESSSRLIVEIIVSESENCPSCTQYYDYEATVSLRETPQTVAVFHSDPKPLEGWSLVLNEDSQTTDM
ncbi:hypothetical protein ELS19_19210 [Halogeometricum borinquense]|uniref:Lipoprotein n=1 Tax=Halogeometricum borinquense TaxID=60847 RepID=A0A482T1M3_9EURY|nr:hypothetical protein ELS19_19210 [Halogeometricum borinquense]